MSFASLDRRLARLEVNNPKSDGLSALTDDELQVALLDAARTIADNPEHPEQERDAALLHVVEVEASIRHQAGQLRDPAYAAHLEWVRGKRWSAEEYVPALCATAIDGGGFVSSIVEYADLHRPRVKQRRAALRARPDIAVLIAEGAGRVTSALGLDLDPDTLRLTGGRGWVTLTPPTVRVLELLLRHAGQPVDRSALLAAVAAEAADAPAAETLDRSVASLRSIVWAVTSRKLLLADLGEEGFMLHVPSSGGSPAPRRRPAARTPRRGQPSSFPPYKGAA